MGDKTLMATNNFKAFALDPNANVTSQVEWEALPALLSGFSTGKASSAQINKAIRQATFIASAVAQFVSDALMQDIFDNGDSQAFVTLLKQAIVNGSVPAGIPMPWPTATPPAGWLKCNGANFNTATYPLLAKAYPSGKLPDLRGEFIRGWDDGRGVDSGRAMLSTQGDAIRNIKGEQSLSVPYNGKSTGVFYNNGKNANEGIYEDGSFILDGPPVGGTGGLSPSQGEKIYFDASRIVPVASENRPRNVAFNYIVRAA